MSEPEPSNYLAEERAKRYTYAWYIRAARRMVGWLVVSVLYYLGYDVSAWQLSTTPAVALAQGMLFVFIRAVYGLLPDVKFPLHWQAHKDVLPRGPYLYYRDDLDPIAQANKLWETCLVNGGGGELPPVVDVEGISNPTLTASKIRACVERVHQLFGDVMIYTGYYVWRDEVTGDKTWAAAYKLWIAAYPFRDWKPEYFELVKNYPPLIPAPWTQFAVWQFTSKLPAVQYGVSGTYTDGNYATEAFAVQYHLTQSPPDPDPTGDPLMQFIAKFTFNIRSSPVTTPTNDVGDLPGGSVITALEVRPTDSNSVWVRFDPDPAWVTKAVPEYWAAMVHDGQWCLNFHAAPPPVPEPMVVRQTVKPTALRWYKDVNAQGKPIMSLPPVENRPKFAAGAVVACAPGVVDADGPDHYYQVLNGEHASPQTYPPTGGETGWFVLAKDVYEI